MAKQRGEPGLDLQPVTAGAPWLPVAARIYVEVFGQGAEWAEAFLARYAGYPDYRGYVARLGGVPVGMGFGVRSLRGNWWHDRVAARVGAGHPALQDAWVLVELAVLAPYRKRGRGGALHDALLAAQPCPRVLLSTQVSNWEARLFYERRGWRYLHAGFAFKPGAELYAVMHRELAERP